MALYYMGVLYDAAREKAAVLHEESQRLFLSCSGGVQRLGGEDDWDAPLAIELGGVGGYAEMEAIQGMKWTQYLGVYKLENRDVNGKPAWRHAERGDLWLAFDGVGWACQPSDRLGDRFGWLQLRDAGPPHFSTGLWQAAPDDGSRWLDVPFVKCQPVDLRRTSVESRPAPVPQRVEQLRDGPCEARPRTESGAHSGYEEYKAGPSTSTAPPAAPPPLPKPMPDYIAKARSTAESACL